MTRVPEVGAIVRPVGSAITYRVVASRATGCSVEAIASEVAAHPGRASRPLHYSERRASLALSGGTLFDAAWRAWEVVPSPRKK